MNTRMVALALSAVGVLAVTATAQDQPRVLKTVEYVAKLADDTTSAFVQPANPAVIAALVRRFPKLEALDIREPSNRIELAALEQLAKFDGLRSLSLKGDPFLYDKEFAAIGRVQTLTTLRLCLP